MAQTFGDHFSVHQLARWLNETQTLDMHDLLKLLLLRGGRPRDGRVLIVPNLILYDLAAEIDLR